MHAARRRWLAPLGVIAVVLIHWLVHRAGTAGVAPRPDQSLRVVSWNLRNFPGEPGEPGEHDRARLQERLRQLDPHVLALQEIRDPSALAELRPGWRFIVTEHGGRHGPQHLAVGWDPSVVEITQAREHFTLTMGGRVRPALSVHVRASGGPDFYLVVVHLKATPHGYAVRKQQWSRLRTVLQALLAHGPDEDDLLLLGDFNATGGPDTTPEAERQALARVLADAGLQPWDNAGGCTAYWDGTRRDRFWEPSLLDLVWSAGLAEVSPDARTARPGTHCAHHRCTPFSASEDYPEPDLQHLSDHCPVVLDLPRRDDDP